MSALHPFHSELCLPEHPHHKHGKLLQARIPLAVSPLHTIPSPCFTSDSQRTLGSSLEVLGRTLALVEPTFFAQLSHWFPGQEEHKSSLGREMGLLSVWTFSLIPPPYSQLTHLSSLLCLWLSVVKELSPVSSGPRCLNDTAGTVSPLVSGDVAVILLALAESVPVCMAAESQRLFCLGDRILEKPSLVSSKHCR